MKKILGHRGFSHRYPENTMLAFERAIETGCDGVEFDVQLSRDGVPVIIHDEDLNRVAGEDALVKDLTLAELQKLDVSYKFRDSLPPQRIPTLEEYLARVQNLPFLTNIEFKTAYCEYPGIEETVCAMVRAFGLEDRMIYSSFNHYTLLRLKKTAPAVPLGVLYGDRLAEPQDYAVKLGARYLHPMRLFLNDAEFKKYEKAGVKTNPWTVDEEADIRTFLRAENVFAIITNRPDYAMGIRAEES